MDGSERSGSRPEDTGGILPNKEITGPYDVVTLVDVIEHVSDPIELLVQARTVLASDGIGLVITPDVASVAARVMVSAGGTIGWPIYAILNGRLFWRRCSMQVWNLSPFFARPGTLLPII